MKGEESATCVGYTKSLVLYTTGYAFFNIGFEKVIWAQNIIAYEKPGCFL
jgi:hypothetical protein